jgi:hypothetical protein
VGPGREDLACSVAAFLPGQPAAHERGLEDGDRLLAVGVGRAEVTAIPAWRGCCPTNIRLTIRHCPTAPSRPA